MYVYFPYTLAQFSLRSTVWKSFEAVDDTIDFWTEVDTALAWGDFSTFVARDPAPAQWRTLNGLPRFLIYTTLSFQLLIDLFLRVNLRQFMSQLQVKLSLLHNPIVDRLSQSQGHHRGLTAINWMLVLHTVDTSMLIWGLVNWWKTLVAYILELVEDQRLVLE
jgi:hypothetical protein